MLLDIKSPISVKTLYDWHKSSVMPYAVNWEGRVYAINKLGLHYKYKQGTTLFHVFSVSSKELSFKLVLDTGTLFWTVEQISDGLPE